MHGSQFSYIHDKPDILMITFLGVWYSDKPDILMIFFSLKVPYEVIPLPKLSIFPFNNPIVGDGWMTLE